MENQDVEYALLNREDMIFAELKQLRKLLSNLIGTQDLPAKEKFSREAISKAAKEFRNLQIARKEWIESYEIKSVIKHANYNSGKILIEQFQFKNYFKRGSTYYFKKKDLIDLAKELRKKNINLEKYDELLRDKEKFQKYLDSILQKPGAKSRKRYKISEGLENIFSVPYTLQIEDQIRDEINVLMEEYNKFNLSEYVDLYEQRSYSLFKYQYNFDRYLKPELKKYCKDWCFKFNYAQAALKRIIELK
ncbi:MAG: hypothetical protein WD577_11060 [Bacteroidales bacterium]